MSSNNKTNTNIKITRDSNIFELTQKYPDAVDVLAAFGLHCASCFASQFDTIGQGAEIHGMDNDEIEEMIQEVNAVINGKASVNEYK